MAIFELVAGDTGSKLVVTVEDNATGAVVNLTGATVKLFYAIEDGALQGPKPMTVTEPEPDVFKAEYQFLAGELTAGTFRGEIEVTDSGGKLVTSLEPVKLPVRARLG